jgi:hypothetical protein
MYTDIMVECGGGVGGCPDPHFVYLHLKKSFLALDPYWEGGSDMTELFCASETE